jgi:hypothetical protein
VNANNDNNDTDSRSTRACFACVKARARCSRTEPCQRCSIRSIECAYADIIRRDRGGASLHDKREDGRIQTANLTQTGATSSTFVHHQDTERNLPQHHVSASNEQSIHMAQSQSQSQSQPISNLFPQTNPQLIPHPNSHPIQQQHLHSIPQSLPPAPTTQIDAQHESLQQPTTSINWLSMNVLEDWDFNLDFNAMSQGFQTVFPDFNENSDCNRPAMDQIIQETTIIQRPAYPGPCSARSDEFSPNAVALVTASDSPNISLTTSTPAAQMDSVVGGLYRHGQGSKIARQRSVFARAIEHTTPSPSLGADFHMIDMDAIIEQQIGPIEGFSVPSETYNTILRIFEKTCLAPTHPQTAPMSGQFIPHRTMEACIAIFFKTMSVGLPIVHEATLMLDKNNWMLALVLCTAGCSALQCPQNSQSLLEFLRRVLALETTLWSITSSLEQVLASAQVTLLSSVLFKLQSHDQDFQTSNPLSVLATICRKFKWLESTPNSVNASVEQSSAFDERAWKTWALTESGKRIAYATMVEDQLVTATQDMRSTALINLSEATGELPCHEKLWNAKGPNEWLEVASKLKDAPTLQTVLHKLYSGESPDNNLGDFARIFTTHALCRQALDVRHQDEQMIWRKAIGHGANTLEWQDQTTCGNPHRVSSEVWRNSTLDCLDIMHWHAHEMAIRDWGLEPGQVLHLHLTRLILLTPFQDIEKLILLRTTNMNSASPGWLKIFLRDTRAHQSSMTTVARWLRQDYFKARLAVVHAGALLWHMRRYSVGSHFEPFAIYMACVTIWAYGTYCRLLEDSHAAPPPPVSGIAEDNLLLPPMIQIDRPCDDELVQTFIRQGNKIPPYMTGVGFICESGSAARVPTIGADLLGVRCYPWVLCEKYQTQLYSLSQSCAG